jgi:hypothetical protein
VGVVGVAVGVGVPCPEQARNALALAAFGGGRRVFSQRRRPLPQALPIPAAALILYLQFRRRRSSKSIFFFFLLLNELKETSLSDESTEAKAE